MAYGTLAIDYLQSGTVGSPVQFKDSNGTQIGTLCRAWVNFNGTGTVAIRGSGNVSSITDNGVGSYTVNFTTAMPDANYAPAITVGNGNGTAFRASVLNLGGSYNTSAFSLNTVNTAFGVVDENNVNVSVFR